VYPIAAGVVVASKQIVDELVRSFHDLSVRVVFEMSEIPSDWTSFIDRIERLRPDVILLQIDNLREPLEQIVTRIRSTSAQPAVFALSPTAEPDSILTALRAGVTEYLHPPFTSPLKAALERLAQGRERSGAQNAGGRTVAFLSAKGGCGATTLACHVAVELSRLDVGKILLADLDLQAGMVGFLLKAKNSYSVADAVRNLQRLDQSLWKGLVSNGIPNLEIISAPVSPFAKELALPQLKQVVAFARTQYEWIVLDLGRNMNSATFSLLDQVDEAFLVTTHEVPALHECKQIVRLLLESGYAQSNLHVILNRNPKRSDLTLEEMESILGTSIYATIANDYQGLQDAFSEGRLIEASTSLGKDFTSLAARIAGVSLKKKKFNLFGEIRRKEAR
jgi:pilus assembly protein CpaE